MAGRIWRRAVRCCLAAVAPETSRDQAWHCCPGIFCRWNGLWWRRYGRRENWRNAAGQLHDCCERSQHVSAALAHCHRDSHGAIAALVVRQLTGGGCRSNQAMRHVSSYEITKPFSCFEKSSQYLVSTSQNPSDHRSSRVLQYQKNSS